MAISSQPAPLPNHITRKISELVLNVRNTRTHSEAQIAQIAASIKEFGFTSPVLVDESNVVIAGEGRVRAATKLQMDVIPCIVLAGLTEQQKAAYGIADNKLALNSGWNLDMLRTEILSLSELDLDLNLTGFDRVEVLQLFDEFDGNVKNVSAGRGDAANGDEADAQTDWSGMPNFEQNDDTPFRSIQLHFESQEAVDAFAALMGQTITDKTKYLYYPQQIKRPASEVVYA